MLEVLKRLKGLIRPSKQFECEWCVGYGNFMVPDPTAIDHPELRKFVKGKLTRVTVEIIGDIKREHPTNWIDRGSPADEALRAEECTK